MWTPHPKAAKWNARTWFLLSKAPCSTWIPGLCSCSQMEWRLSMAINLCGLPRALWVSDDVLIFWTRLKLLRLWTFEFGMDEFCILRWKTGRMLWFKSNVSLPVFRPSHLLILTLSCVFLHAILQLHVQLFTYMHLLLNTSYERDVSLVLTVQIFHFCGGHMHKVWPTVRV